MAIRSLLTAAGSLLLPAYSAYEGMVLPPRRIRTGGPHFQQDAVFAASAKKEAKRLQDDCGLTCDARVLEIGCGPGRLPIGILAEVGDVREYLGLDVNDIPIRWCQRYIQRAHPIFRFVHIDVANPRYNKEGRTRQSDLRLPCDDGSMDIVYLYSVFSHLMREDVTAYLREFRRILAPQGTIFLTAFVEEHVPDEEENPAGYGNVAWHGRLHCVRFAAAFFQRLIAEHGLAIHRWDHGTETDGQSGFLLRHAA